LLQNLGFQTITAIEMWYVFRGINTKLDNEVKKFIADVDSMQNQMPFYGCGG
jgi:hypothetical protein